MKPNRSLQLLPAALLGVCLSSFATAAPTMIAGWDFQTTTNGGTAAAAAPNSPLLFTANFGAGTLYLNGTNGSSTWIAATTGNQVTAFGGSSLNTSGTSFSTTTTGAASLALLGGTSNAANGQSLVFAFSTIGYGNLSISYATQRTGTGFNSQVWSYSTNGTTWTTAESVTSIPSSFAVTSLATITGLDNVSTAFVKLTVTGASSSSGNNRLDNIQFNATAIPEPSSFAALAGIAALGFCALRRRTA